MTALPLLIAASLIFSAGWVASRAFAAHYAYREGFEDGYDTAQREMADDVVMELEAQFMLPSREGK